MGDQSVFLPGTLAHIYQSGAPRMPVGTMGFRWDGGESGKWNLKPEDPKAAKTPKTVKKRRVIRRKKPKPKPKKDDLQNPFD